MTPILSPCDEARRTVQDRLDGPIDAERDHALRAHLSACAACREYEEGLLGVQKALGALPEIPLPDETLEAVWDRTVRARRSRSRFPAWAAGWSAAAAVLVTAVGLTLFLRPDAVREPSPDELARAAEETRLVLTLTARALRQTELIAVDEVLANRVSPTLRRIPIRWPEKRAARQRRSDT